ncbi:glutathione S-transferase N-terminal domain-containing protein [Insolitispirillum peregrinum]|uniref:glutathione S-transferase N-terminal domain-containing protein n=1 Tax=Insolitispirillum peregrinum TaxID=80876 RepID=UPI0036101BD8
MSLPSLSLLLSFASPFANKVMKSARYLDIPLEYIEEAPYDSTERLLSANPLSKVPALLIGAWPDGGSPEPQTIFDSAVICHTLEQLAQQVGRSQELLPARGPGRWRALRDEALCDGISEAALLLTIEGRRPPEQQSESWQERWQAAIWRGLADLDQRQDEIAAGAALPRIALGAALDYLDLRHADRIDWRSRHLALEALALRP